MAKKNPKKRSAPKKHTTAAKPKTNTSWLSLMTGVLWRPHPSDDFASGKQVFLGILGAFALAFGILSFQVGINGDEDIQDPYSDAVVDYYLSFGADTTLYNLEGVHKDKRRMIKHYGAIYELPAGAINRVLGLDKKDRGYHYVRHLLSSLFGLLTLFFAGRCAHLFGGWRAAICAVLVLGLSPRFFGHCLINPKDIPFACGYMMSLYYLLRLLRSMPKPHWRDIIWLGVGMGITISARANGILVIAYAAMFLGLQFLLQKSDQAPLVERITSYAKVLLSATGIGLVIGTLFWPYALDSPMTAISSTLEAFTNFPVSVRLLFSGDMMFSSEVGWRYIPEWWLVSSPVVMLVGLVIALAMLGVMFRRYPLMPILVLGFAFLFPILYTMYKSSSFYGGMRHMMFAYCCAATLSGIGWSVLGHRMKSTRFKLLPVGLMALLLLEPAIFLARNTHVPYVFFNTLVGGASGAQGYYELDTQGISVKQGLDWLIENELRDDDSKEVVITSNYLYNVRAQLPDHMKDRIKGNFSHHRDRFNKKWDYAIYICHFIDGEYLRAGTFPGGRAIYNVEVDGVPVATVLKRGAPAGYDGVAAYKANDMATAISSLNKEVSQYPKNDVAWATLGSAFLRLGDIDQSIVALNKALGLHPTSVQILNDLGTAYLQKGDINKAEQYLIQAVAANRGNVMGYYRLATIYRQKGDLNRALDNAKLCVGYGPTFKAGYQLAADILRAMGDERQAQAYLQAMNR